MSRRRRDPQHYRLHVMLGQLTCGVLFFGMLGLLVALMLAM